MFLHLFIISRSGGLIFNQDLSELAPRLNANDWLRLGSTFHGFHAIASQIAPVVSSGIEKLETDSFVLRCFQPPTGIKFVITAEAGTQDLEVVLQRVYQAYTDYVLKNPFYELEMPIRCELFTEAIARVIQSHGSQTGKGSSSRAHQYGRY
uniref:Trafficking protein particle complex subunit n=1 Tax=Rhizochromulina marina TaxID=1034831 RepID=A0A7S2RJT7_9STRA|mmetsp:Transcript_17377/g.50744  ORF Transcript_17377/g.50744 Transcript_17377/m.50744 type:complete len:151 (+) Transcript_17377:33-485(+)